MAVGVAQLESFPCWMSGGSVRGVCCGGEGGRRDGGGGGEMEGWRRGDWMEGREDGGDRRWRGWKMEGMEDGGDGRWRGWKMEGIEGMG